PPVDTAKLQLPAECSTFLNTALTKKPQDRFQSAPEMAAALLALQKNKAVEGTMLFESPPTLMTPLGAIRRFLIPRKWIFLSATGVIAFVGSLGLLFMLWNNF